MTDHPPPLRPLASAKPGSWWSRHKWWVIVPLATLTGLAASAGFVALILWFVFNLFRSSEPYQTALLRAQNNPAAVVALGKPITPGWLIMGTLRYNFGSAIANFSFPVSGPHVAGEVHVVGSESDGVWTYTKMDLTVGPSHQVIDLTKPAP